LIEDLAQLGLKLAPIAGQQRSRLFVQRTRNLALGLFDGLESLFADARAEL
jgi:hypothetical protein